jgi:LmbE family N-acetylglucosaminyl deacetylase
MVNMVGDFSNRVEIGPARAAEQRERVVALARDMGAEKVLLDYKYQQVYQELEACQRLARVVAEARPDAAIIAHQIHDWHLPDHAATARIAADALQLTSQLLDGEAADFSCQVYFACDPFRGTRTLESAERALEPNVFVDVTRHVEEICRLRFELDRIMTPDAPEQAFFTLFVEPVNRATGQPGARLRLTAHAERQFFAMRLWGGMAGVPYAEAFRACAPRTKLPPRDFWV